MEARNGRDLMELLTTARQKGWSGTTLPPGIYSFDEQLVWPALENFAIVADGVILKRTRLWPGPAMVANGWKKVKCSGLVATGIDTEQATLDLVKRTNAAGTEPTADEIGCAWQINQAAGLELERVQTHASNVGIALVQAQGAKLSWLTHTGHWTGKFPKLTEANVLDKVGKDLARTCYGLKIMGGADLEVMAHKCFDSGGAIVVGSNDGSGGVGLPKRLELTGCEGARLGDNGIYISSAESSTVNAAKYTDVPYGHCAKARGSNHTIKNSFAERCHKGFAIEPLGQAHSVDCKIIGNTLTDVTTGPISTDEWLVTEVDPATKKERAKLGPDGQPLIYRVNSAEIRGNTLHRCDVAPRPERATEKAPVRETFCVHLSGGEKVTVSENVLNECGGVAWLRYAGDQQPRLCDFRRHRDEKTNEPSNPRLMYIGGSLIDADYYKWHSEAGAR